jgi:hypothetical protein
VSVSATLDPAATYDELAALFQSSESYYLAKWSSVQPAKKLFRGFNWAAFLFGATWLFYRRLWKAGACCYLAEVVLSATLSGWAFFLCLLIFRLALGSGANSYYFWKASQILAVVRRESLDSAQRLERLKALGGTSETAVVIVISANVILTLVFLVLAASQGAV